MTVDTLDSFDRRSGLHAIDQDRYTLGISGTAACKLHIKNVVVHNIKCDLVGANALGGKCDMFIHGFHVSCLIKSCTQVGYIV